MDPTAVLIGAGVVLLAVALGVGFQVKDYAVSLNPQNQGRAIAIGVLGAICLSIGIAILVFTVTSNPSKAVSASSGIASSGPASPPATSASPATATPTAASSPSATASPSATLGSAAGADRQLRPESAVASAEKEALSLTCTGQRVTYTASQLVDGDLSTGWGVAGDGANQSVTVRLAKPVRLHTIGITPGYLRTGPRVDSGCLPVSAFPHNRQLTAVRYTFDDGSSVVQTPPAQPVMQLIAVNAQTRSVTVTILSTSRPEGADDDAVVSELSMWGQDQ